MNINTFWCLFLPVLGIVVIGLVIIGWQVPASISANAEQTAITNAGSTVYQFKTLRKYYVKKVLKKVMTSSDIKDSINHQAEKNSIPLPVCLTGMRKKYSAETCHGKG